VVRPVQGYRSAGRPVRTHHHRPYSPLQPTWLTNSPCFAYRWAQDAEFKDKTYFAKFDVDEVPDLATELGIRAMPTFVLFKDGEKAEEFVGASPPGLLALLKKYNPAKAEGEGSEKAESPKPE
jgi:hypothetical protein